MLVCAVLSSLDINKNKTVVQKLPGTWQGRLMLIMSVWSSFLIHFVFIGFLVTFLSSHLRVTTAKI